MIKKAKLLEFAKKKDKVLMDRFKTNASVSQSTNLSDSKAIAAYSM